MCGKETFGEDGDTAIGEKAPRLLPSLSWHPLAPVLPYYLLIPHCWKGEKKKKKGTKQHQSRRGTKQDAKSTGACPPRAQHTHNFPAIVCILDHSLLFFLWWLQGMNGRIATCGCAGEGVFARSATLRIFLLLFFFFLGFGFFFLFFLSSC